MSLEKIKTKPEITTTVDKLLNKLHFWVSMDEDQAQRLRGYIETLHNNMDIYIDIMWDESKVTLRFADPNADGEGISFDFEPDKT